MKTPFPVTYRELWLPQHIRGTHLPPSAPGGHLLTLTGASKRTTADGVHFTGAATSNIVVAANADQNGKAACHITIRFKLDQTFAAGAAGNFYLFRKVDGTTYIRVYLKAADGKLYWEQDDGAGGAGFSLTSTTVSWTAGTWYTVTVSLTDGPAQRLLVNGTAQDTDTSAAVVTPSGGDMVIGSSSDGGTDGVVGTISWVVIGVGATATVALTTAEETDLNKGIPPATAKVQYMYLMDEGLGTTVNNRGNGAVTTGTLDSACTWQFGQVKAPVLSLDGVNDAAASAAAVDITGNLTLVGVFKMKSTYSALSGIHTIFVLRQTDAIYMDFMFHIVGGTSIRFRCSGEGGVIATSNPAIDDYWTLVGTRTVAGAMAFYVNGVLQGTATAAAGIGTAAAARIGMWSNSYFDVSKALFAALIEGVLTAAQVKAYSRYLRDKYNLPGTFA